MFDFVKATEYDSAAVLSLYKSAIGTEFCTWNEYYPTELEIGNDIKTGNLFLMKQGEEIIGAISIEPENELDGECKWQIKDNAAEIARVVIAEKYKGQGHAKTLVSFAISEIKNRGFDAVHLSVAKKNIPAYKTYKSLGFETLCETDLYGNRYYLCEKKI